MKKRLHLFTAVILFAAGTVNAQTGIGTFTPDPSAQLEVAATNKGFLLPRLDEAQRDAIVDPAAGLIIFNTTENCLQVNIGTPTAAEWVCISGVGAGSITGFQNCEDAHPVGSFTEGQLSSGTKQLDYTGGNGGRYNITVASTGVSGLMASGDGTLESGDGTLALTVSGTPASPGTATFDIDLNGQACSFTVEVAPASPHPLPSGVTLTDGQVHTIISAYDVDYLPYSPPSAPTANPPLAQAADGTAETTAIDIQGVLPTTGVTINIPYQNSTGANVQVPGFTQTVAIPVALAEDGAEHQVQLSYPSQSIPTGSGSIPAILKAVGSEYAIKRLDVNNGIGDGYDGLLLATFQFPKDNLNTPGYIEFRTISVIPDRAFDDIDPAHQFVYAPIVSVTGKAWLNNNLGANYSNMGDPAFAPGKQGQSFNDVNAYGGLYQWGRYGDGHEIIDYSNPTNPGPKTDVQEDNPTHGQFIYDSVDWRVTMDNNLWNGGSAPNNPCPLGFHVPTDAEMAAEITAYGITNLASAYASDHKFVAAGGRYSITGEITAQGTSVGLWTSMADGSTAARVRRIRSFSADFFGAGRGDGWTVRCLQD